MKISAVIITYNEEQHIENCILSLKDIVDEIVVLDSLSTDKTKEICFSYGIKVYTQDFLGYSEQKNKANLLASNDWIFSIDADELLSYDLQQSLLKVKTQLGSTPISTVFKLNRANSYFGKIMKNGSWYPDIKIRLFNRTVGKWEGLIHEILIFNQKIKVSVLEGDLLHYSYSSLSHQIRQLDKFTDLTAEQDFLRHKKYSVLDCLLRPFWRFMRDYFFKMGFKDGFGGYMMAKNYAFATALKCFKLREKHRQEPLFSYFKEEKYLSSNYEGKILISRTDNLKDVALTLPLCGLIKEKYPKCKIVFAGKAYTKELIDSCVYVDEFMDGEKLLQMPSNVAISELQALKVDAVVEVFPQKNLAKLYKMAGIALRIATSHRLYNYFYCNRLINFSRKNSSYHEVCLNTFLLKPLGIYPVLLPNLLHKYLQMQAVDETRAGENTM